MRVIYIAHPLGSGSPDGRIANIKAAERWVVWAAEVMGVAPIATWTTLATFWDESKRDLGLSIDVALVERCDEVWMTGERLSAGMMIEGRAAKRIVDLTCFGDTPPTAAAVAALRSFERSEAGESLVDLGLAEVIKEETKADLWRLTPRGVALLEALNG